MKLALPVGILWLLIVAGSTVIFDFGSRGWQAWAELIAAAFLASLAIVRTLVYIHEKLPGPKIRPAKEGELLIIVAKFRGPESLDPQRHITKQLREDLLKHPTLVDRVRVSRFPEVIEEESQEAEIERARVLGETYGATLVFWGEHDRHSVALHYLVTQERERIKTLVKLQPRAATADLDQFVMYVSKELPEAVTCLSLFTIGQMYYSNQRAKSLLLFSSAIDHLPSGEAYQESAAAFHFYRGNTYYHLDKHDLAIADYSIAIELRPDWVEVYVNRGFAYNDKGKCDLAIADYDKAIRLRPDLAGVYYNRGLAYDDKGEYDLAIADYDRAIKLKPGYADPYYGRGLVHKMSGEKDEAIRDFERFLELSEDEYWSKEAEKQLRELRGGIK